MACLNADGSLTPIARMVLTSLDPPASVMEVNQRSGLPLYRIRGSLRELHELGMLEEVNGVYQLTSKGSATLHKQQS